jgi:RNA polymerase sigma-70 factor (ECF subfamily)
MRATPPLAQASSARNPTPGAAQAIEALLASHGAKLHGLALRMCGNKADADDMVQEVFLTAFAKWHTFQGNAKPSTWLYTIAARACKARSRRKGGIDRRTPAMSQLLPWQETSVMAAVASPREREHASERAEAIARVQQEIARLPEHLRMPLIFKDVLELSVEDTSAALGLASATVKTRVHRARLALRKAMIARAKAVAAPAPLYEKQVCLDLLKAKLGLMDAKKPVKFAVPQAEVCARCRAVFAELDLVQDACLHMSDGQLPSALRARIVRMLKDRDKPAPGSARRGRPPVSRA